MSGPYAPGPYGPGPRSGPPGPWSGPKRLTRSRTDKFLGGVCGGVAQYLNMDPTLVRVLWAVLSLVTSGAGLLVYIVMLFVVPEEDRVPPPQVDGPGYGPGPGSGADPVWGAGGAPWEQPQRTGSAEGTGAPVTPPPTTETPRKGDDPVS